MHNTGKMFLVQGMQSCEGEKRCIHLVLNPGSRWRWGRSFKPQSPLCWENSLLYAKNRSLWGPIFLFANAWNQTM